MQFFKCQFVQMLVRRTKAAKSAVGRLPTLIPLSSGRTLFVASALGSNTDIVVED